MGSTKNIGPDAENVRARQKRSSRRQTSFLRGPVSMSTTTPLKAEKRPNPTKNNPKNRLQPRRKRLRNRLDPGTRGQLSGISSDDTLRSSNQERDPSGPLQSSRMSTFSSPRNEQRTRITGTNFLTHNAIPKDIPRLQQTTSPFQAYHSVRNWHGRYYHGQGACR